MQSTTAIKDNINFVLSDQHLGIAKAAINFTTKCTPFAFIVGYISVITFSSIADETPG